MRSRIFVAVAACAALVGSMLVTTGAASARVASQVSIGSDEIKVGGLIETQFAGSATGAKARFADENAKGGVNGRTITYVDGQPYPQGNTAAALPRRSAWCNRRVWRRSCRRSPRCRRRSSWASRRSRASRGTSPRSGGTRRTTSASPVPSWRRSRRARRVPPRCPDMLSQQFDRRRRRCRREGQDHRDHRQRRRVGQERRRAGEEDLPGRGATRSPTPRVPSPSPRPRATTRRSCRRS